MKSFSQPMNCAYLTRILRTVYLAATAGTLGLTLVAALGSWRMT